MLIVKVRREIIVLECYKVLVVAMYAPAWSNVLHSKEATNEESNQENKIPDNSSKEKAG
jgi:hypothetical protein